MAFTPRILVDLLFFCLFQAQQVPQDSQEPLDLQEETVCFDSDLSVSIYLMLIMVLF